MLVSVLKGEYIQDAGEGDKGILRAIKEPHEACKEEPGEEELELCFGGKHMIKVYQSHHTSM